MRVLVTGGTGYFGSHACKALVRAGHLPVTFDDLSAGHRWAVDWGPVVIGDLADTRLVKKTLHDHAIDAVMHFADSSHTVWSAGDQRSRYRADLWKGIGLIDALLDAGVRQLVFSSSCTTTGSQEEPSLDEMPPETPDDPYTKMKLAFARALRWYGQAHGLRTVSLWFFNAVGAQDSARDIAQMTDLAQAHVLALDHLACGGNSLELHVGTGRGYSVREVSAVAAKVAHGLGRARVSH